MADRMIDLPGAPREYGPFETALRHGTPQAANWTQENLEDYLRETGISGTAIEFAAHLDKVAGDKVFPEHLTACAAPFCMEGHQPKCFDCQHSLYAACRRS